MDKIKELIIVILSCYGEIGKLKDTITELFDEKLSLKCPYNKPPKFPEQYSDDDMIYYCEHEKAAGICCIDECPLWRDSDEKD